MDQDNRENLKAKEPGVGSGNAICDSAKRLDAQASTSGGGEPAVLALLAAHQSHWLERILLPALAVGFTTCILTLARSYVLILAPTVTVPAWVPLAGSFAALESVYLTPLLRKARAPVTTRVIELGLLLAAVYLLLRVSGRPDLLPVLPFSVWRKPQVYVPLLLVAFGWLQGGAFGDQFLSLGSLRDVQVSYTSGNLSWEQEALLSRHRADTGRASAVSYLSRKVLFYPFIFGLLAAIVVEGFPNRLTQQPGWAWPVLLATSGMLLTGLAMQGCVYLYRMETIWREAQVEVDRDLPSQWVFGLFLFLMVLVGAGTVLPAGLSPLRFTNVMYWLGSRLSPLLEFGFGNQRTTSTGPDSSMPGLNLAFSQDTSFILGLIQLAVMLVTGAACVAVLLVVIGALVAAFVGSEIEKLPALIRLPVLIYLWIRSLVLQLVFYGKRAVKASRRYLRSAHPAGSQTDQEGEHTADGAAPPSALALYVRHLFLSMVRLGQRHGVPKTPGQTPIEYGRAMERMFEPVREHVEQLTALYIQARYSLRPLHESVRAAAKSAWEQAYDYIEGVSHKLRDISDEGRTKTRERDRENGQKAERT